MTDISMPPPIPEDIRRNILKVPLRELRKAIYNLEFPRAMLFDDGVYWDVYMDGSNYAFSLRGERLPHMDKPKGYFCGPTKP